MVDLCLLNGGVTPSNAMLKLSIKSQEGVDYALFIMAEGGC